MENTQTTPQLSIHKIPVIPFKLKITCSCGGELVFHDSPVALHPRVYKHKCTNCGFEIALTEAFPKTIYEEITDVSESN